MKPGLKRWTVTRSEEAAQVAYSEGVRGVIFAARIQVSFHEIPWMKCAGYGKVGF
jgi:hypothetical protein